MIKLTVSTLFFCAAMLSAQETPENPLVAASKGMYAISKDDVMGSVEKIPDALWSYQPTKDVRTAASVTVRGGIHDGSWVNRPPPKR